MDTQRNDGDHHNGGDTDGTDDAEDAFPFDSTEDTDTDGDLIGDNADVDDVVKPVPTEHITPVGDPIIIPTTEATPVRQPKPKLTTRKFNKGSATN